MSHFMNLPSCVGGSDFLYVNNPVLPTMNDNENIQNIPVDCINSPAYDLSNTHNTQISERKRQLSDQTVNYSDNEVHKKLKHDHTQMQPQTRVAAMILQLSTQFMSMRGKLNQRINDLETI